MIWIPGIKYGHSKATARLSLTWLVHFAHLVHACTCNSNLLFVSVSVLMEDGFSHLPWTVRFGRGIYQVGRLLIASYLKLHPPAYHCQKTGSIWPVAL